ncbi:MAG: hypothetical protein R3B09_15025 [Nannocystaceae bacterium]
MDDLDALQEQLRAAEADLAAGELVALRPIERDGRAIHVVLTPRFYKLAQRARLWRSSALPITLKNAGYGFDPARARSLGGRDGIFLLDRGHDGPMTRKIYGGFLDRPERGADEVAAYLGATLEELQAVRLVSHHLRLLGVLRRRPGAEWLVIVDLDRRG